jgi:hypothetical protein
MELTPEFPKKQPEHDDFSHWDHELPKQDRSAGRAITPRMC